jgi:hypothetical protein
VLLVGTTTLARIYSVAETKVTPAHYLVDRQTMPNLQLEGSLGAALRLNDREVGFLEVPLQTTRVVADYLEEVVSHRPTLPQLVVSLEEGPLLQALAVVAFSAGQASSRRTQVPQVAFSETQAKMLRSLLVEACLGQVAQPLPQRSASQMRLGVEGFSGPRHNNPLSQRVACSGEASSSQVL